MLQKTEGGVTAAKGFKAACCAAEIKYKNRTDMAMVYSESPCECAGTFTSNVVKAACVQWDQKIVYSGKPMQAVVCNTGIANACTGQEGWGAVVNESMGCGCGLIASYGAGATPYLVKQSLNGLIYNFKSHKELALCIENLLDNPDKAKRLGKAAYETIVNMWNASNAANRFIALSSKLLEGKSFFEEEGPLSKAENISMRHAYKLCRKDEVI